MKAHLRIARPVSDIARSRQMYCDGLGLSIIGGFENHQGFDGVMLGREGMDYHFEFTLHRGHPILPGPTVEDVAVFYVPDQPTWTARCEAMLAAGFILAPSYNPYWDIHGKTFVDPDGYRVVIQNAQWENSERR